MVVRDLLEGALLMFMLMEVVVPLILGRPLFGMFRRRATRLLTKEAELKQQLEEDRLREKIAELERRHAEYAEKETEKT